MIAAETNRLPYHCVVSITDACNIRCVHCYGASAKRSPNELTTDELKSLLTELADIGVFDVAISGGEALIRSDALELIRFGTRKGLNIGLVTNGWFLTDECVNELVDTGVHRVQVSIDGTDITHDKFRRRLGLYQKALDGIDRLIDKNLTTNVCFTPTRLNIDDFELVVQECVSRGVYSVNFSQYVPTGRGNDQLDFTSSEWNRIMESFQAVKLKYQGKIRFTSHLAQLALIDETVCSQPGFVGCQAGISQAAVSATGDIFPCVLLPYAIGNVRKGGFAAQWSRSKTIAQLQLRDLSPGKCRNCNLLSSCGGCRATAYSHHGNLFGDDPHCWKV